ncbi:MAG: heavy-metal-associated domain-containing protein [Planctomycetota bacterium]
MRTAGYAIAVIAAVGIMIAIVAMPSNEPADDANASQAPPTVLDETSLASLESVTLNVPEMHCPFACYPAVKETLEASDQVASVELAPQKEEGVIDNPQVIVKHRGNLNLEAALAALEASGFDNSTAVQ